MIHHPLASPSTRRFSRRQAMTGASLAALLMARRGSAAFAQNGTPDAPLDEVVIDLGTEPPSLDPAIVYETDSWSIVHSIHDALIQYGPDGELQPLLAESLTQPDPLTYEVKLRPGLTFHNGEPVDARAVAFSIGHIVDERTASQVAQNFAVIEEVQEVDPLTVRLALSEPAPWLPAQMAAWLALLPPGYAAENDIGAAPVGTGPFTFVEWEAGSQIVLAANPAYFAESPKGQPIAQRVVFRFVPEPSTRVADLLSGSAGLIRTIPDQVQPITDAGATVLANPISGAAFIRIATDTEPFSDPNVRQAVNYAVDVESIIDALLNGNGRRLANFFPEGGLGFDPDLSPYPFDPDRAKALLAKAGYPDGFATALEYTTTENANIVAAVAGQLEAVGIEVALTATETATFNQTWADPSAPPLRFATWKPLFDPHTLLSLLVAQDGYLSRYANPDAQALLEGAAAEPDTDQRAATLRELGRVLHDEPAAIYLYSLTALYGADPALPDWTPRPDDYIIPTRQPA